MVILAAHNHYQQPGGEDQVFAAETELLEERGHQVLRFTRHNEAASGIAPIKLAALTIWNRSVYREVTRLLRLHRPDVVHVHNTLPLVSPSIYFAANAARVPVVQTLHNFRLYCVNALFFRDGHVCMDCAGKAVPWPGILHACYRDSHGASAAVAATLSVHRVLRTWSRRINAYIALTDHARSQFVQLGLPRERIFVKPNFMHPDPGAGVGTGGYGVFIGRLVPEKGVLTLLDALTRLGGALPMVLIGGGPLAAQVAQASAQLPGVRWVPSASLDQVCGYLRDALFSVVPSEWYEGFPRVIVESLASGTPVLVARTGALPALVAQGRIGQHFTPGDAGDLAKQMAWFTSHQAEVSRMRFECRREFELKYSSDQNYQTLMGIYREAIDQRR